MNAPTEKLVSDVRVLASDVEELVKATAAQTGERIVAARARAEAAIMDARATAMERSKEAARVADDYVHENPWTAIGVSAGVGMLIGLLASRR